MVFRRGKWPLLAATGCGLLLSGLILAHFIEPGPDGTIGLTLVCRTAGPGYGRDGTCSCYTMGTETVSNDGKGTGPFVSAGTGIARMDSP